MLILDLIKSIDSMSDSWVRVDDICRIPGGLDVCFSIHEGRGGKTADRCIVACRGVREVKITDLNGGGLALYPASHPAAQQYIAQRAELRWPRSSDKLQVLAALQRAHLEATDDWIPFDRYLLINAPWNGTSFPPDFAPVAGDNFVCRCPDFLVRAYAKALSALGERVQVTLRAKPYRKSIQPRVLHFGSSYIVANVFTARR